METLEVTGIKRIIWIDDDFAESVELDRESLIGEILINVEALMEAEQMDEVNKIFSSHQFDYDAPNDIILSALEETLREQDNDFLKQVAENFEGENTEYSQKDLEIITSCIKEAKIALYKMSLSEWKEKAAGYDKASVETLFLIDKEFTKEGFSSDEGTEVLKELIRKYSDVEPPNFILFTHTCRSANDEEHLRRDIFNQFKADDSFNFESFNFQVLSKSVAYDKSHANTRLFSCIRAIFVRKLFSQMAHGLRKEIIKSIDDVTDKLISTNVYGLDKSIFGSSISEGISELELLQRIYSLSQRAAVTSVLTSGENIVRELTKLRQLRLQTETPCEEVLDLDLFKKIRSEEFWYNGEDINKTHSPIVCGDIFKIKKNEFILLSQPCDTILRNNGKRKANMAILAPIKKYQIDDPQRFEAKFQECASKIFTFVFRETNIENSFWCINLNQAVPVSLDILDLCSFNGLGKVEFRMNQDIPPLLHLDGQVAKFLRFRELGEQIDSFPCQLRLDTGIFGVQNVLPDLQYIEGEGWFSNLTRVRRLDSVYSEHALNKYFSYKSRKAFEHDFTRH